MVQSMYGYPLGNWTGTADQLTSFQMSGEIENASVMVRRAIIFSILINGGLGFGMLIVTLFSLNDVKAALETPTRFPFMEVFFYNQLGPLLESLVRHRS